MITGTEAQRTQRTPPPPPPGEEPVLGWLGGGGSGVGGGAQRERALSHAEALAHGFEQWGTIIGV